MKKIIVLGCVLLFVMSCKAQTIVPIEKAIDYRNTVDGIPDNTYLKDVNNLLSKYVGTWKGIYAGKTYTFFTTKYAYTFDKVTYDILLMRYLITSSDGTILEDTRSLPNDGTYVIEGDYFTKDATYYVLNFTGKNAQCGNQGTVYIRMKNTENTQMSLTFEPNKIMISKDTCPGLKLAEQILPRNGMRLTKQ